MSEVIGGSVASSSVRRTHGGLSNTLSSRLFSLVFRTYSKSSRNDFLSLILVIIQVLQLGALVINSSIPHWHPVFDPRPLLSWINLPLGSTIVTNTIFTPLTLAYMSVIITSILLLTMAISALSTSTPRFFLALIRGAFDLVHSTLFIPLSLPLLTALTCFNDPSLSPFMSPFSPSNCWTVSSWVHKLVFFTFLIILFCLCYLLTIATFDSFPTSKKIWARSNNRFHRYLFLSKAVLLIVLVIVPHRILLFNLLYTISTFAIPFCFSWYLPFYKRMSNIKFSLISGILPAFSLTHLIIEFVLDLDSTKSEIYNTAIFISIALIFSFIFGFICSRRCRSIYDRFLLSQTKQSNHQSKPQSFGIVDVSLEESDSSAQQPLDQQPLDDEDVTSALLQTLPKAKYPFEVELFTRFLFPKPHSSEYKDVAAEYYSLNLSKFHSNVEMLLLNSMFELHVTGNLLSGAVIWSKISDLDLEPSISERILIFNIERQSEDVRRNRNFGDATIDSNSLLNLQSSLNELNDLQDQCLESLYMFWSILSDENPSLKVLPHITEAFRQAKSKAEGLFTKLSTAFPDNKEVIRSYSCFVRDVLRDDEGANLLNEQLESLSNASSDHNSSRGSSGIMSTRSLRKRKRKRSSVRAKISSLASHSETDEKSSIELLSKAIYIALVMLLGISIFAWINLEVTFNSFQNDINVFLESSNIAVIGNKLSVLMREFHDKLSYSIDSVLNQQKVLLESAELLSYYSRNTFIGTSGFSDDYQSTAVQRPSNSDLVSSFRTPSFLVSFRRNTVPPTTNGIVYSFWELILHLSSSAARFGNNLFNLDPIENNAYFRDVTDNRNAFNQGNTQFKAALVDSSFETLYASGAVFRVALIVTVTGVIVVAVFLFARALESMKRERVEVLNLFLWLPKSSISNILNEPKFSKFNKKKRDDLVDEVIDEEIFQELESVSHSPNTDYDIHSISIPVAEESAKPENPSKYNSNCIWVLWLIFTVSVFIILLSGSLVLNSLTNENVTNFRFVSSNILNLQTLTIQITTLDYIGVSRAAGFVATGDLTFYSDYWSFLNSGEREYHLMNLLNYGLSVDQMERVSETDNIKAKLSYLEAIAQYLAASAYNVDWSFVFHISDFNYDLLSETDGPTDLVRYSDIFNWYTNNTFDSTLSQQDQLELAREVLTNNRYGDLIEQNNQIIRSTISEVESSQMDLLNSHRSSILNLIILEGIVLLVTISIIVGLIYTKKFIPQFRHSNMLVIIALVSSASILAITFVYLIFSFFTLNNVHETSQEGVDYLHHLIDLEFAFLTTRYQADEFVFSRSISDYLVYWERRNDLENVIEAIQESECNLSNDICNRRALFVEELNNRLAPFLRQHLISFSLVSNVFDYDHVTNQLDGFDWDIQEEEDFELIMIQNRNVPITHRYTNSSFDLSRDPEEQLELAINLQFGNQMLEMIVDAYRNVIEANRQRFTESILSLTSEQLDNFLNQFNLRSFSFMFVAFNSFVGFFVTYLATRTLKKNKAHVKQAVDVPLINQFVKQYQIALGVLLLFISLFFGVSLLTLNALQYYPEELSKVSTRASQTWEVKALLLDYLNVPEQRSGLKVELTNSLYNLRSLHADILFKGEGNLNPSAGRDYDQNNLLFNTKFSITNSTDYGLHVVLTEYVSLLENLLNENDFDFAMESNRDRIEALTMQLEEYNADSLNLYRDEAFSALRARAILSRIFLVLFLVVIVSELAFVFRTMLQRLRQEEVVDNDLISMIPNDVIDKIPLVKSYVDNKLR
ncbi:hypothetical protein P9112_011450 [Eukaryota sp. TZLM1-RC]